jgi:hypothetical protein
MKEKSLKLTGRVVSVNAADQSILLESVESRSRLRVYADDGLFKKLNHILVSVQFNDEKNKDITRTFYIQGRVLINFIPGGRNRAEDIYQATIAFMNRWDRSK